MRRRTFVQSLAVLAASRPGGLAASGDSKHPGDSSLCSLAARPPGRLAAIGLQLYTVRSLMQQSVERTLEQVAAIGYKEVEFAGHFERTPAQIKSTLKANGLRAPAAHVPVQSLKTAWSRTLDEAETVGHEWVLVAWLPETDRTPDGMRAIADLFNEAGAEARRRGLRFAYHNHDFEFLPMAGGNAFDLLLSRTDPKVVEFEMDLYWITKAGGDPLAYWRKYPGRFPLVHVKDSAGPPEHRMVDVGKGKIPWARLFGERKLAGIKHYFVEHDNPPDPLASARASYNYLSTLKV